jgi:hypothetical protein
MAENIQIDLQQNVPLANPKIPKNTVKMNETV